LPSNDAARTLLFSLVVAEPLALEPPLRRPSSSTRSATAVRWMGFYRVIPPGVSTKIVW